MLTGAIEEPVHSPSLSSLGRTDSSSPLRLRRPSPSASPARRQGSRPRLLNFDPVTVEEVEKYRCAFLHLYELAEEPAVSGTDSETEDIQPRPPSAKRERHQKILKIYRSREDEIRTSAGLALEVLSKLQHALEAKAISDGQITTLKNDLVEVQDDLRKEVETNRETKVAKLGLMGKVTSLEAQLRTAENQVSQLTTEVEAKDKHIAKMNRDIGKLEPLKEKRSQMDSELEAVNVQLLQARASENSLRRKYKKLSARCVELQAYHDRCKQEHAALAETEETMRKIRKRESSPILKPHHPPDEVPPHRLESSHLAPPSQTTTADSDAGLLLTLVRELSASNTKLKTELAEAKELNTTAAQLKAELEATREMLYECRNEIAALSSVVDESVDFSVDEGLAGGLGPGGGGAIPRVSVFAELESYVSSSLPSQGGMEGLRRHGHGHHNHNPNNETYIISKMFQSTHSEPSNIGEDPSWDHSTTASEPHHRDSDPSSNTEHSDQHSSTHNRRSRNLSRNNSTGSMFGSATEPATIYLRTLHKMGDHLFNRLLGTDTVSLNRKIRRTFDLAELSRLSNNVIENILADINELERRFPLDVEGGGRKKGGKVAAGGVDEIVIPLVILVQSLLSDIAMLRMTLNDYALIYYEKISEKSAVPVDETPSRPRPGNVSKSRSMGSLRTEEGGGDTIIAAILPLFRRKAEQGVVDVGDGSVKERGWKGDGTDQDGDGAGEQRGRDGEEGLPSSGWMKWLKKNQL
ncbi:hypothetical protein HK097_011039 [Rhizophlyctis rosea]|uniref:Uncharacterized protein n=1 Tax=Rhizophlyctis rosea TaxID=64517 RepID=A0AAD5X040_9FUNG|nr:hypothetical protein HK097_011039 [Rhizophlyctis rosea]